MDQRQARWVLLKISMVAVSLSSWIFTSFVFDSRPPEPSEGDPIVSLMRLPASLPGVPAHLPKLLAAQAKPVEPIRMDVLRLACWDTLDRADEPVAARWVRLTGRPCQSDVPVDAIEVSNLSTGYTGTVFMAQQDLMTTDFIPMREGANDILIRFSHGEGMILENRFTLLKAGAEQ